jgi:hypothetical protein
VYQLNTAAVSLSRRELHDATRHTTNLHDYVGSVLQRAYLSSSYFFTTWSEFCFPLQQPCQRHPDRFFISTSYRTVSHETQHLPTTHDLQQTYTSNGLVGCVHSKYYLTKQTSLQHVSTSAHQYMCIKSKFGPAVSSRKVPKKFHAPNIDVQLEAEPVRTAYKPTRWVHINNVYYTGRFDCRRTTRRTADEIVAAGRPTTLSVPQDSVLLSPLLDTPSVVFRCI